MQAFLSAVAIIAMIIIISDVIGSIWVICKMVKDEDEKNMRQAEATEAWARSARKHKEASEKMRKVLLTQNPPKAVMVSSELLG